MRIEAEILPFEQYLILKISQLKSPPFLSVLASYKYYERGRGKGGLGRERGRGGAEGSQLSLEQ